MEYGILSIVPTIVAVGLALTTKNVYVSLLLGLVIGNVIIFDGNILSGVDGIIKSVETVFADGSNLTTMLAISLMGGMILLIQKAGGVNGFIDFLTVRTSLILSLIHILNLRLSQTGFSFFSPFLMPCSVPLPYRLSKDGS